MMETDDCCPLCMEDMDVTDKNFRPCKCGYQICLFCYRHIKDDLNGLCPACRTPYDEANVTFVTPDPQEMAKLAKEKKAKELKDKKEQQAKEKRDAELKSRQEAQTRIAASAAAASAAASAGNCAPPPGSSASTSSVGSAVRQPSKVVPPTRPDMREVGPPMRVIQRTLVYVMGLSPRIAKEDILRRHEYFGQYGKILRIQVNSSHLHSASNGLPSCSCYITYSNRDEAEQAILAVDNVVLDGRALKASFGTTKSPHAVAQGPNGTSHEGAPLHEPMAEREEFQRHAIIDPGRSVSASAPSGSSVAVSAAMATAPPVVAPTVAGSSAALTASLAPASVAPAQSSQPERPIAAGNGNWDCSPPSPSFAPVAPSSVPPPASRLHSSEHPPFSVAATDIAAASDLSAACSDKMSSTGFIGGGSIAPGASSLAAADVMHGNCPMGSDAEPWAMLGSFEDLLNGIVDDDDDDEEETSLPGSSRFARFFSSSPDDEPSRLAAPSTAPPASSPLSSLGGIKLEAPEAEDNWQQGFRALLPNVNISFSAFGDGAMPPGALGSDVLAQPPAQAAAGLSLGSVGGLGGLVGFGAFGSSALSQQPKFPSRCNGLPNAPHSSTGFSGSECGHVAGGASCASGGGAGSVVDIGCGNVGGVSSASNSAGVCSGNGGGNPGVGSSAGLGGNSFALGSDQLACGFGAGLGSSALNGAASSEVSLLSQLSASGPLPGAQLPNSQLSSQLQSLLQGANSGHSAANGLTQSSQRAVGGGLLPNSDGSAAAAPLVSGASPPSSGLWSGSSAGGLMPGWLPSEGLLPLKGDDSGLVDQQRDLSAAGKMGKKDVSGANGGADRGAKPKNKRGGTSNRGGKGESKPVHK
eukprot:CAMPEP_0181190232 /NCGR_PEP_ID=MMETSP1096-20121128/12081_1 /TAXON_ID=156174 ORGANISM="Chrysochromulina ericina, Strain CCMP281" /NCGR_SAMPLE_ID=MMETSP1096 /ASSEMBLY_ACC=CAM_ASM_000453 /LENGTH=865 /DNA_ID=CAMNT_0023279429 /DNA_START=84 /DNA_END=2681 /DNA_ORIENTATION=+